MKTKIERNMEMKNIKLHANEFTHYIDFDTSIEFQLAILRNKIFIVEWACNDNETIDILLSNNNDDMYYCYIEILSDSIRCMINKQLFEILHGSDYVMKT